MKFATIGHLLERKDVELIPKAWIKNNLAISPEMDVYGTKGYITGLMLTASEMISFPRETVRQRILDAAVYLQDVYSVDIIQLGALTTSVTDGGKWVVEQKQYKGFTNHGDSYTASVTCQAVQKALSFFKKEPSESVLAIVGAYGVIGEAVSRILVPQFKHSILIGRTQEKFKKLEKQLEGNYETLIDLRTKEADIIVTATSHPTALLNSSNLSKNTIVVDVSQPPNLSYDICLKRPDVYRVDGGFVDFPVTTPFVVPGVPPGKNFACVVEVIMQAIENEKRNHVGSIDLKHLRKTEKWAEKYGFTLKELTNYGKKIG